MAETTHGLRTSFRTWAAECTSFPAEIAEQALAHVTGNAVEQAYQRSDVLEKRRELMQAWADHCNRQSAEVIALRA
jgi:integrase